MSLSDAILTRLLRRGGLDKAAASELVARTSGGSNAFPMGSLVVDGMVTPLPNSGDNGGGAAQLNFAEGNVTVEGQSGTGITWPPDPAYPTRIPLAPGWWGVSTLEVYFNDQPDDAATARYSVTIEFLNSRVGNVNTVEPWNEITPYVQKGKDPGNAGTVFALNWPIFQINDPDTYMVITVQCTGVTSDTEVTWAELGLIRYS